MRQRLTSVYDYDLQSLLTPKPQPQTLLPQIGKVLVKLEEHAKNQEQELDEQHGVCHRLS